MTRLPEPLMRKPCAPPLLQELASMRLPSPEVRIPPWPGNEPFASHVLSETWQVDVTVMPLLLLDEATQRNTVPPLPSARPRPLFPAAVQSVTMEAAPTVAPSPPLSQTITSSSRTLLTAP